MSHPTRKPAGRAAAKPGRARNAAGNTARATAGNAAGSARKPAAASALRAGGTPAANPATPGRPPREAAQAPYAGDDVTVVDHALLRRAVGAMALGNAMEWFDFGVYSYIAVTLGKVFFPSTSGTAQLIATFGTFAAAFLVRPIGGMVFGPLGDRIGRQRVLAATMIMMACGTFAIGLIPSYAHIGILAPVLLLVARLVQGFSTGGEYGGAATFIAEFSADRHRGFMGSFLEFGTLAGYLLGAGTVTALTSWLSPAQMLDWGWRVPFFVAGPLGLIGLYIRTRLEETPAFRKEAERLEQLERERARPSLAMLLAGQWRALLVCVGLVLIFNVTDYMALAYLPNYLSATLHFDETHGLVIVLLVMALMMPLTLGAGWLSDRVGRRPVMLAGCVGLAVCAMPALLLLRTGQPAAVFGGMLLLGVMLSCFCGVMPSALPALFPTRVRYSSLAIGFNVSVSLFGGTTPLVTAWLVGRTGDLMMPAYYLMGAAVIGAVSVLAARESAGRPLPGSAPSVATQAEAARLRRGANSGAGKGTGARVQAGFTTIRK